MTTPAPSGPDAIALRVAPRAAAQAIARLHHDLWHETYAALAPPDLPALMTLEARRTRWRAILDEPGQDLVMVARAGDTLAGFMLMGPPSEPAFGACCEIRHLFVRGTLQGRGLGRRLLAEAARRALDRGETRLGLGVVDGNRGAIAFYTRLGGRMVGAYTDPGPRWRSRNLIFVWDDLPALAASVRD